jgi:hypothetical protein
MSATTYNDIQKESTCSRDEQRVFLLIYYNSILQPKWYQSMYLCPHKTKKKVSAIINIKTMILNHFYYAKFQVLTAVLLTIKVLGDATVYCWVSSSRHFEEL